MGYVYRPVGMSLTVADFSLYCGKCARRAIVVRHVKIQHSSACCGTVDCKNRFDFVGSMPQANNDAVIWNIFSRNSFGSYGWEIGSVAATLWRVKYSHMAMSSNANQQWNTKHLLPYFVCQPTDEWHRNSFQCEGCQSVERPKRFSVAILFHSTGYVGSHENHFLYYGINGTNLFTSRVSEPRHIHMLQDIPTESNIPLRPKHVCN